MPQIRLKASGVLAGVCQRESASVPEHVRVRLDFEPSRLAGTRNQLLEVAHGHRRTALGYEHERTFGLGAIKST
jgi:hypothetical protein